MSRGIGAVIALAAALTIAGCGGSSDDGGGGNDVGADGATFADRLTVTSADERVAHGLQAGRYRLNWDAECQKPTITLTPAEGGDPAYSSNPNLKFVVVNSLAAGLYFVDLEGDDCGDWEITMTSM